MAIFTVHLPPESGSPLADAERAVFLPDRYSWGAMVFGPLWFLSRRAWLGFLAWVVLFGALAGLAVVLRPSSILLVLAALALAVYFGIEGREYLRLSLERRGFRMADIVGASTAREAELTFFCRWLARPSAELGEAVSETGVGR